MRVEPEPSAWQLPDPADADPEFDVVAVGADLAPGTILQAYRTGLFPMSVESGRLGWWSPDPRGILPLGSLRVSRSLRKSIRRFSVTVDQEFTRVMRECGDERRESGWITEEFIDAYSAMHRLGWAHSVEVWREGDLVGGLYGLEIGGLFAGESMFHHEPDASKVALHFLVSTLIEGGGDRILDVQWCTTHLASLGAVTIPRGEYLERIVPAQRLEPCFTGR